MITSPPPSDVREREQLIDRLWLEIQSKWRRQDLRRVQAALDIWCYRRTAHPYAGQEAKGFYIPDLPDEPWIDPGVFPFTEPVGRAFPEIARETAKFIDGRLCAPPYGLAADALADAPPANGRPVGWREWRLASRGNLIDARCADFPATARVVRRILDLAPATMNVTFMILLPGCELKAHCDFNNAFVNVWMALFAPEDCAIVVAGQRRVPRSGEFLAFNHSYQHESWNRWKSPRVVFSVSALHPRLTPYEAEIAAYLMPYLGGISTPNHDAEIMPSRAT